MRHKVAVVTAGALAVAAFLPVGAHAQSVSGPVLGQNHRLSSNTPGRHLDVPGLAVDPGNPNHIVEADVNPVNFQCDYHVSFDGGRTWTGGHLTVAQVPGLDPPFPSPACAQNFDSGGYAHFNTGIVFGSGQNVYITFSVHRGPFQRLDTVPPTEGGAGDDVVVARSADGGRTFQPAVLAIPGGGPNPQPVSTRPQIAVERGAGEGGNDRLYVNAWEIHIKSGALGPRRMLVSRSDDGGRTWRPPVVASKIGVRNPVEAEVVATADEIVRELSQPVVGPPEGPGLPGAVYAAYKNADRATGTTCAPNPTPNNCIVVAKSTDRGVTWSHKNTGGLVPSGGQPRLAIDPATSSAAPKGTLYVVYHNGGDILLQRSTDGGQTWSSPSVRVDEGPPNTTQSFPQVSVGPGGRVNVIWFDGRHSYPGGGARLGNIYSATSTDGGQTFPEPDRRVTDRTFNRDVGLDSPLGTYSFYGPVAQPLPDGSLLAAWTDSREGDFDDGIQDIYLSRLSPAAPTASSRIASATTPGLSVMLSRLAYPGGTEATGGGASPITRAVVAGALAGAVLARANWGPLLLSRAGGMPGFVKADATRIKPIGGYLIGDTSLLSPAVEQELQASTREGQGVTRVAPAADVPARDRPADTARQVAELMAPLPRASAAPGMGAEAVIANPSTPEAAAGSALAAALKLPILFVDSRATPPPPTTEAIGSLDIESALIVGGPRSVNADVENSLKASLGAANVKRLGGADQYATSEETVKEAKARGLPGNVVYVADGERPIDGALLGAATGRLTGLMLLTRGASTTAAQARLGPLEIEAVNDRVMAAVGTGGVDPDVPRAASSGGGGRPPLPPLSASRLAGCRPAGTARNLIALTSRSDRRNGTRLADLIFAGTGNDVVDGREGDDCIDLGPGRDRGQGGTGDDLVQSGSGNDVAHGSRGRDRLFGGSGNDRLVGNSGNDALVGGAGRDRLYGGSRNDRISAGTGNDRISAGSGSDRVSAGRGNDRISAADRRRDRVYCGSGRDRVTADRIDFVARSCERVRRR